MATFDISRVDFDPRKHYSSVRMQQGRVMTDDDWNENERIENEERRRSRSEIIGPFGSPDLGFRIENLQYNPGGPVNFNIHAGVVHLGGLRLEMDQAEAYRLQKDWLLQPHNQDLAPTVATLAAGHERFDMVYVEAWQQAVSAVEDESLFEVALGGPDTSTRVRTMRRVKIWENTGFKDCPNAWNALKSHWSQQHLGMVNAQHERVPNVRLSVSFNAANAVAEDLCSPSAAGGYLGAENQAIRVQLTGPNHLTWGFDNGAPLYRVKILTNGEVKMLTEPKDQYHWPLGGQIVEFIPWSAVLPNGQKVAEQKGTFRAVSASYDPDAGSFHVLTPPPANFGTEWTQRPDHAALAQPDVFYYMRIWNRGADTSSVPEIPFTAGTLVTLGTTGLQIKIVGNDRVAEDYWVITVRPETPNVVVPWALSQGMAPFGVRRFYAPLAVIRWVNTAGQIHGSIIHDCRKTFRPLTDLECCCTYTVGDGIHSHGDYSSIQEAIDNLPDAGGKICVLPGEHIANAVILKRRQIRITGCGEQTIVRPGPHQLNKPIFLIENSEIIRIDHLTLITYAGTSIELIDQPSPLAASRKITIDFNNIIACIHAINIVTPADYGGDNEIRIAHNLIAMIDKKEGKVAIFCLADDVLIERNRIVVVPPPTMLQAPVAGGVTDIGNSTNTVFDPCATPQSFYSTSYPLQAEARQLLSYFRSSSFNLAVRFTGYVAMGGIQIGGTSERVRIVQNEIAGGRGNGITLGNLPEVGTNVVQTGNTNFSYRSTAILIENFGPNVSQFDVVNRFNNVLYDITIQENNIQRMGLSGISAVAFLSTRNVALMVRVEGFWIYGNVIQYCARQIPSTFPNSMLGEFAFGGITFADAENGVIRENRIEENGLSHIDPICGIFFLRGEKIDISNNRISNNGPGTLNATETQKAGVRAGIMVRSSFKSQDFTTLQNTTVPSFDGIPAVKVHDNIVTQPLGHALFLVAFGPVSVVGNQFTSQGSDRLNPLSHMAAAVYIFNLGISKDFLQQTVGASISIIKADPPVVLQTAQETQQQSTSNLRIARQLYYLQYLPSGRVMFTSNQTTLDMRSPFNNVVLSAQLIHSRDDVAFNNNQSECESFAVPGQPHDTATLNTYLYGASVRANDNRFTEGKTITKYSLFSYGYMNTALGNQSTHCLHVFGNPLMRKEVNNTVLFWNACLPIYQTLSTTLDVPAQS